MNNKLLREPWLQWAIEIQSIAQAGLAYGKDVYDIERYERIREISAEMISYKTEIPVGKVKELFCNEKGYQTPKLDTRAAIFKEDEILLSLENLPKELANEKNTKEQIKMCFEAKNSKLWETIFD